MERDVISTVKEGNRYIYYESFWINLEGNELVKELFKESVKRAVTSQVTVVKLKGEASPSIQWDWVNEGWF